MALAAGLAQLGATQHWRTGAGEAAAGMCGKTAWSSRLQLGAVAWEADFELQLQPLRGAALMRRAAAHATRQGGAPRLASQPLQQSEASSLFPHPLAAGLLIRSSVPLRPPAGWLCGSPTAMWSARWLTPPWLATRSSALPTGVRELCAGFCVDRHLHGLWCVACAADAAACCFGAADAAGWEGAPHEVPAAAKQEPQRRQQPWRGICAAWSRAAWRSSGALRGVAAAAAAPGGEDGRLA